MSDEDAFIAGIREHPLDDLRRLVYADWLDERERPHEAEYLRLVAALAEPATAIDVNQPLAKQLLARAGHLDSEWREVTSRRFDLWVDGYESNRRIALIKELRLAGGFRLSEAMEFTESLPKVLGGTGTFEEVIWQAGLLAGTTARLRIMPAVDVTTRNVVRYAVFLRWSVPFDFAVNRFHASLTDTRAAFHHLRRLLLADPESAPLAASIPELATEPEPGYWVTLARHLTGLEADQEVERWKARWFLVARLDGDTADPPFLGWIDVCVHWPVPPDGV